MATNFQAVDSQLDKIKTTLSGISSNLSAATPEQRKQLEGAFKTLGGTLSSEQARRSVANAQSSAPGTTPSSTSSADALAKLAQEKAAAETRAKEAEAKKKEAEAAASIADQRVMKDKTKTGTSSTAGVGGATEPAMPDLLQTEPELADYGLTEENMQDPMVVATLRNQVAMTKQLDADAQRLSEMVGRKEERTQQQVALIGQSIANQTAQLKVEQRKRMAAEGMGSVLGGRGLYSPEEHQGIIQEVVQDGILKLQEIQIEGYKLQNEMWDDFENYEYEAYTKKSEILKEYNKLELDTVTAIQERLQSVAKAEQEKLVFDQAQMDRSSLILAEELVGASDEAIREAAKTQGVDYGLLKRAVADATFTQEDRALSLTSKRLSIAASQKALSEGPGSGTNTFTEAELADIETYAQEMIDDPEFKITNVPQAMRAAVIAKKNALEGDADTAELLETGGQSFIDWVKADKTKLKFVKSEFADKAGYSWMVTPKGWDVERAMSSEEGQNAVQIAIEQGAKSNEEIYQKVFGANGIIPEFLREKAKETEKKEGAAQKSANSTAAFPN